MIDREKSLTHNLFVAIPRCKLHFAETWLYPVALLFARFLIAGVFLRSGLTKLSDWNSTLFLFEYEYAVPLLPVAAAAFLGTAGELILPFFLKLGLGGRVAAFGLFIMTLVIELTVYPGTTEHYFWLAILGVLIVTGPGTISVDHWIRKRFLDGHQLSFKKPPLKPLAIRMAILPAFPLWTWILSQASGETMQLIIKSLNHLYYLPLRMGLGSEWKSSALRLGDWMDITLYPKEDHFISAATAGIVLGVIIYSLLAWALCYCSICPSAEKEEKKG